MTESWSSTFCQVVHPRLRGGMLFASHKWYAWAMGRLIATFFGAGLVPKAPGTAGSVASMLLWYPLARNLHWGVYGLTVCALIAVGLWASQQVMTGSADEDPQIIVIDEVAGMGVTFFLLPAGLIWAGVGLVFFRIFDVWKIGPIGYVDRKWRGPLAVMADDVLAGVAAWIFTQAVYHLL